MKFSDYHTHTPLCLHAEGTPQEYVQASLKAGLVQYGISDHAPMNEEPFDDWRMKQSDLPLYFEWIDEARRCADGTGLEVLAGLECDWMPGLEPWIEHLRSIHDWDYFIGSVHYLDNRWDFDNPQSLTFWDKTNVEEAWGRYWQLYAQMAATGLFQIMGHADLIRKFGHRPAGDLKPYYMPAIEAIANSGAAVELNTTGWYKPCAEQYPSQEFLTLACEAGVPLVINSDSHAPQEVGRDFGRALDVAKSAGYTKLARIIDRKLVELPIE